MPQQHDHRVDPETGVPVLTTAGFLARVAEHDGTTPARVMVDLATSIENERHAEETRLRDPAQALGLLRDAIERENRWRADEHALCQERGLPIEPGEFDPIPVPTEVIEVQAVEHTLTLSAGSTRLHATARRADGSFGQIAYWHAWTTGTYLDQPEDEEQVDWFSDPA